MKKLLTTTLSLWLVAVLFSGCISISGDKRDVPMLPTDGNTPPASDTEIPTEVPDTDTIIVSYIINGNAPADFPIVQDAVNEHIRSKINVAVVFELFDIKNIESITALWLATGKIMDLMTLYGTYMTNMVNIAAFTPLDDLLAQYAPTLTALNEKFPITGGAVFDGVTYGVSPVQFTYGFQGGLAIHKGYFDETGFEAKDIYTYDELTQVMAAVKANHPDCYPYQYAKNIIGYSNAVYFMEYDTLGASAASGVLMSSDSTTVVNLFETKEYKEYLKLMSEWHQAGYIRPGADTSSASPSELLISLEACSIGMNLQPPQQHQTMSSFGWETLALPTTRRFLGSQSSSSVPFWTIPFTATEPEAAMRFLDLMFTDTDLSNLLKNGIEDVHYVKTGDEGVIDFPEGIHVENSPYYMPFNLYGDLRFSLRHRLGASFLNWETFAFDCETFFADSTRRSYPSIGYSYNSKKLNDMRYEVRKVLDLYLPSLESGSAGDWEASYEDMLAMLTEAGIDDIIADNQTQLNAFLANR